MTVPQECSTAVATSAAFVRDTAFATGGAVSDLFSGSGGAAPQVNVRNNNMARPYMDPAHVASEIGKQPQFGRDAIAIAIVIANKGKLGL